MKQITVRLTALLLALVMTTTLALAANKSGYSDVPDKHWAAESIAQCKQYNLLQGIGNGKFGLGQKMTRAAYAAALCRLMGWKTVTPEKGSFTDNQDTKKWYFSAIETANEHDVFPGHSTTCRPNEETKSKRLQIKQLIRELKKTNPEVEAHIFRSMENVCLDTVIAYKTGGKKVSFLETYDEKARRPEADAPQSGPEIRM